MLKSPFFSLLKKEFYSVWRDKKSRSVLFLPPILQLFIFSHAATLDITNIKIGILDKDNTEVSREFQRQIKSSKYFGKIYNFDNNRELINAIDEEKIRVGVYINNDFTKKYKASLSPEILIITDGRHTNASQIIASYVNEISTNFSLIAKSGKNAPNVEFEVQNRYNPNLSYHFFIVACLMGILPMTVVVLLSALSLARERENGTFDELMVVPLTNDEIVWAKLLIPVFFGCLNGVIILILAKLFFNLPFMGSFFLYLISLLLFLLSVAGIGLFVSAWSKTQQQAMLLTFFFMFPSIMLSGYTSPIENITPKFLQWLTFLNPLRFFLVISKGIILKNINYYYILLNFLPLTLLSIFTIKGSKKAFKNKLE